MQLIDLVARLAERVLALEAALLWGGVFTWLAFAVVAGAVASGRGQAGFGFFALALLLSPLVAFAVVFFLPDARRQRLVLLETRLAELERQSGRATAGLDPSAPPVPVAAGGRDRGGAVIGWILAIIALVVAIIGGVSQLGSSANATFTTIDDDM